MDDILIRLEDALVERGGKTILSGVSLKLHRKQALVVIGPNGAGKTTLARVVMGLETLNRGRLIRAPGMRVGYVPQSFARDSMVPIPVIDFLNLPRAKPRREIKNILESLGIAAIGSQPLSVISDGEMKYVLIARALLNRPDLLLFDEPAASLDEEGQGAFYKFAAELPRHHNCALMVISHDTHLVMAAADEVLCLNTHICCRGSPLARGSDEQYSDLLKRGGALALYRHHHDHTHDPLPPPPKQAT